MFTVNFVICFRITFLQNISGWLLLLDHKLHNFYDMLGESKKTNYVYKMKKQLSDIISMNYSQNQFHCELLQNDEMKKSDPQRLQFR